MLMHGENERMHGDGTLIGTSGWSYDHWKGHFYPPGMPAGRFLPFYAGIFPTVEINSTFYRPHKAETYARWAASVPAGIPGAWRRCSATRPAAASTRVSAP